jgi:hypothetical protein
MAQWDNPETDKLHHTRGTEIYNARCLPELLIGSLTYDAMILIQHCIDPTNINDGPLILHMICVNIHRNHIGLVDRSIIQFAPLP